MYLYVKQSKVRTCYMNIFYEEFYLACNRFLTQIAVDTSMSSTTHMPIIRETVKWHCWKIHREHYFFYCYFLILNIYIFIYLYMNNTALTKTIMKTDLIDQQ